MTGGWFADMVSQLHDLQPCHLMALLFVILYAASFIWLVHEIFK